MSQEILFSFLLIAAGFCGIVWFLNKKLSSLTPQNNDSTLNTIIEWLKNNQTQLGQSNKNIVDTLQTNTRDINERLDRAAKVIGDLQKEAGEFSQVARVMKDLQDFLKSPKLRGNLGEEVLKDLLTEVFPKNSIFLQYQFRSGEKVDAALKTDAGILPIDSKFPLENFQKIISAENKEDAERAKKELIRDLKKHVDNISKKYILPEEGTVDFAIMYVPSESVYYEIINYTEVMTYARDNRVYMVSPTTLYAHLRIIMLSFEGKRIEQQARFVLSSIRAIQKDYDKASAVVQVLGKHITNSYNTMASFASSFTQLGQKITTTQTLGKDAIETPIENTAPEIPHLPTA